MTFHRTSTVVSGLLLASIISFPAYSADVALAERLFREGKELLNQGRYDEACAKLSSSYREDPATGTLLAVALCQERGGKLASACGNYRLAAERAHEEGQRAREDAAMDRLATLEPRLSKLMIVVPGNVARITKLTVRRNAETLPADTWGSAVPIDGGSYVIEASAPGRMPFRIQLELAIERDAQAVVIPELELAIAPQPEPPLPPAHAPSPPQPTPPPNAAPNATIVSDPGHEGPSTTRILSYATGGSALLGFGLGTFFGLQAKSRNDKSYQNGHCDARGCDQEGQTLRNQAISSARISNILFASGFALTIATVVLYAVSEPKRPTHRIGLRFEGDPIGAQGGTVRVSGEF